MNFVWIYEYSYSFHRKSGIFLEIEYSIKSVKKFYKNAKCFVVTSPQGIADMETCRIKLDATILVTPEQRVMTHVTNHADHFDVLHKLTTVIKDDRITDGFILIYDDIFLLEPMTKKDFKNYAVAEITDLSKYYIKRGGSGMYLNMWKSTYDYIYTDRFMAGKKTYDWETHLPRLMSKKKLSRIIEKYGLRYVPMLMTSFYSHETEKTVLLDDSVLSLMNTFKPTKHKLDVIFSRKFLNVTDEALTPEIIELIKERVRMRAHRVTIDFHSEYDNICVMCESVLYTKEVAEPRKMRVLAISPHCDDIELGCAGYLVKLKEAGHEIQTIAFSHSEDSVPKDTPFIMHDEYVNAMKLAGFGWFDYGYEVRTFHEHRQTILEILIIQRQYYKPDLVLLPCSADIHQDHQVIHQEGVRAFSKDCSVLGYELPWNSRAFNPSFFVELTREQLTKKIEMIYCYKSQLELNRQYLDKTLIEGQARARGLQVKKEFAEAFESITLIQ